MSYINSKSSKLACYFLLNLSLNIYMSSHLERAHTHTHQQSPKNTYVTSGVLNMACQADALDVLKFVTHQTLHSTVRPHNLTLSLGH